VTVTTSDLIRLGYSAHGHGLWLRPNLLEIVTTEIALREVAAQLEPPRQKKTND
jgi:hypothetical protein